MSDLTHPALQAMLDIDSHEMVPLNNWVDAFGPETADVADLMRLLLSNVGENSLAVQKTIVDEMEITEDIVWNYKGLDAPGAIDLRRRPAAMKAMHIVRQLVFPTMALGAVNLITNEGAPAFWRFDPGKIDHKDAGRRAVGAYNRWVVRQLKDVGSDVRCVGAVLTENLDRMMADAQSLIDGGVKAIWIPSGIPPANTSPADQNLDTFWKLMADNNVAVLFHIGTEFGLSSPAWYANVPAFKYGENSSIEFPVEPFRASTINLANENFLAAMILGGVFERHPTLRFGVIECGAQWVGPLAERLDLWSKQFTKRLAHLTMKPSAYLARNVRVTPFIFEPVGEYYDRWPHLGDVYCYSSDYPHREGGKASHLRFLKEVERHGGDVVDRFFRRNSAWLMPN
jgi:hypothetical protein